MGRPALLAVLTLTSVAAAGGAGTLAASGARQFPDRPVAWLEHDDEDVPRRPAPSHIQRLDSSLMVRDSMAGEVERVLALEGRVPARDVNALDEVPCSTWFCARNHLTPMTEAQVAAGAPGEPPRLPLVIVKGKEMGAAPGFEVLDASRRRFMLKFDPPGHLGMATGSEMVGQRIFHAAGYHVPGSHLVELSRADLRLDPRATFRLFDVQKRPLTAAHVEAQLAEVARLPDGRWRGVAVPWIGGQVLGGCDLLGRRADDPNDRIPHQHRRSLRASWILFAWISELDPSGINMLDTYVEENQRRFVRHYIIDFGAGLGSATVRNQGPHETRAHYIEVGRTLGALLSLGLYRRPFQGDRSRWAEAVATHPALGWFPAEDFDPDSYRSNRKLPTHVRMTDRDAYWGAKVATSFTDQQVAAIARSAALPGAEGAYLERALRARRDVMGRRYLRAMTAVENPVLAAGGAQLCFDDLAITRGYARPEEVRYGVMITDELGRTLSTSDQPAAGPRSCVPSGGPGAAGDYRIVRIAARLGLGAGNTSSKAARVHLRWREREGRLVVVGLERDQ